MPRTSTTTPIVGCFTGRTATTRAICTLAAGPIVDPADPRFRFRGWSFPSCHDQFQICCAEYGFPSANSFAVTPLARQAAIRSAHDFASAMPATVTDA